MLSVQTGHSVAVCRAGHADPAGRASHFIGYPLGGCLGDRVSHDRFANVLATHRADTSVADEDGAAMRAFVNGNVHSLKWSEWRAGNQPKTGGCG